MRRKEVIMKQVKIVSGEYEFVGTLLTEEAPETCKVFESMLPIKSKFIHVRWSGEGIWIPYGDLRTGLDYENHISHPAIGEMLLYPGGISEMEIIMSYGRCCFASQYGQLAGNILEKAEPMICELPHKSSALLYI